MEESSEGEFNVLSNQKQRNNIQNQWTIVWIFRTVVGSYYFIEKCKQDQAIKLLIEDYMNSLLTTGWNIWISSSLLQTTINLFNRDRLRLILFEIK